MVATMRDWVIVEGKCGEKERIKRMVKLSEGWA